MKSLQRILKIAVIGLTALSLYSNSYAQVTDSQLRMKASYYQNTEDGFDWDLYGDKVSNHIFHWNGKDVIYNGSSNIGLIDFFSSIGDPLNPNDVFGHDGSLFYC